MGFTVVPFYYCTTKMFPGKSHLALEMSHFKTDDFISTAVHYNDSPINPPFGARHPILNRRSFGFQQGCKDPQNTLTVDESYGSVTSDDDFK